MFSTKKNIFVLAPHTDDGELGAGGTINLFLKHYYSSNFSYKENVLEILN